MANIDLLDAFRSYYESREVFTRLVDALQGTDPVVAVLAFEGLYRIESDVQRYQFTVPRDYDRLTSRIQNFLRTWRCESPLSLAYGFYAVPKFLKSLTIFKTLEVPLFIDDYGVKKLLSSYGKEIENIDINGDTPIFHVTHSEEARKICDEKLLKPSDNKNIIKGCWFGLESPVNSGSVYGNRSFETTLSKLGVTGLHQGEIVAYKNEVNVILYAARDSTFQGLKKPTDDAVQVYNRYAYVHVSIFVPAGQGFFPTSDQFFDKVNRPVEVPHGPFCVRASRTTLSRDSCGELTRQL